ARGSEVDEAINETATLRMLQQRSATPEPSNPTPSRRLSGDSTPKRARLNPPKESTLTLLLQTNQQILAELKKLVKVNGKLIKLSFIRDI
ncbi:MAG: hypothetical protein AAGK05_12660, partial [Pseudomonadota bacterium]